MTIPIEHHPATASPRPLDQQGPDRLRLDDQLCFALYAATNEITRAYRPLLTQLGITYPQYLLLMVLWEHDNQTITHVAHTLHLPTHGLLPVITRLTQTGLLTRNPDPHDRRTTRLTLTPTGHALEHAAAAAQHQVAHQTHLTPTDLANLRHHLHQLIRHLQAQDS